MRLLAPSILLKFGGRGGQCIYSILLNHYVSTIKQKSLWSDSDLWICIFQELLFVFLIKKWQNYLQISSLLYFANSQCHHPPTANLPNSRTSETILLHRVLNPGLITPQFTALSTRPLVSCFRKMKKSIYKPKTIILLPLLKQK